MKSMKNIIKILLLSILLIPFWGACNKTYVDFGEQYKKILYIVNSDNLLFENDHFFRDTDYDSISISIYCAGSESIKEDVIVQLALDEETLDSLNKIRLIADPFYKDKVLFPADNFIFNKKNVTIKKGEQYGIIKIPFTMNNLDIENEYVLPLKISGNNQNFEVNPKLESIVYQVNMMNHFSGDYSGSSTEIPSTIRSVQPTLKALSANSVRMPIHNLPSERIYLETNFMLLSLDTDSVTVHISPWRDAKITDLGGSTYNKENKSLNLNYSFITNDGKKFTINEKITSLLADDN